jgi:Na+-translocating ferredoxin:NAD+ oxidoreductase RnfE subunit
VDEIVNNPTTLYVSFGILSVLYITSCIISGKAQNEDKQWNEIKDDMITSIIISCVALLVLFIIIGGVIYSNKTEFIKPFIILFVACAALTFSMIAIISTLFVNS